MRKTAGETQLGLQRQEGHALHRPDAQTIQPTFDAHKLPGHDNIRNPVDNIIAGVRYAISRYT